MTYTAMQRTQKTVALNVSKSADWSIAPNPTRRGDPSVSARRNVIFRRQRAADVYLARRAAASRQTC